MFRGHFNLKNNFLVLEGSLENKHALAFHHKFCILTRRIFMERTHENTVQKVWGGLSKIYIPLINTAGTIYSYLVLPALKPNAMLCSVLTDPRNAEQQCDAVINERKVSLQENC